jgi:hypothetical protein
MTNQDFQQINNGSTIVALYIGNVPVKGIVESSYVGNLNGLERIYNVSFNKPTQVTESGRVATSIQVGASEVLKIINQ